MCVKSLLPTDTHTLCTWERPSLSINAAS